MLIQKKPILLEAITFEELVDFGRLSGTRHIHGGMPWSFEYAGHPITHENDDCYLIPTEEGVMKMQRGDLLIIGVEGEIYPIKRAIFDKTYDIVSH
jgi:hypothetical protein